MKLFAVRGFAVVCSTCRILSRPTIAGAFALFSLSMTASASDSLPDSPGYQSTAPAATRPVTITGLIIDVAGDAVPAATVTLVGHGNNERVTHANGKGEFTFENLGPENIRLTVTAPGMETYVSAEFSLKPGEILKVPEIILPIEPANTVVQVTATEEQVAQEQMKEEEKQRAFGVLPNFYTSYTWDAAPLNFKQKSELAFRSVTDPVEFVVVGLVAGVEQLHNTFPDYGHGPAGYGRRFGAAYGDVFFSRAIGSAILPTLLHQDPRYFYLGSGTKTHRALYAISTAVICKGDSGHFQPNYSKILGSAAAGAISYAYHPNERSPSLIGRNVGIGVAGTAAVNLVREFLLRRFTPSVPSYEQGKPEAKTSKP